MSSPTECLSETTVQQLLAVRLSAEARAAAEAHIAGCSDCRLLISTLARTSMVARPGTEGGSGRPVMPGTPGAGAALQPGAQLFRYRVLEWVGQGGMGAVYAAYDPTLDRRIALKLLHREAGSPQEADRLLREAKAMARLSHPSVV